MANILIIKNGIAEGVYDDRLLPIYRALGLNMQINRASDVEYDSARGVWVARLAGTDKIIASGEKRNDVIAQEVSFLERGLL